MKDPTNPPQRPQLHVHPVHEGHGVSMQDIAPQGFCAPCAETFLTELHGQTSGYIGFSFLRDTNGMHFPVPVEPGEAQMPVECAEMLHRFTQEGYALYVSVCGISERFPQGSRTQKCMVTTVPGVWADLDVKNEAFTSRDEIDNLMGKLPEPTMVVETGSGGTHPYWLLDKPLVGKPGQVEGADELLAGWYALLRENTDRAVDNVQETARIMRLPGAVRPASGSNPWPSRVRVSKAGGPRYTYEELTALVAPALENYRAELAVRHERWVQREAVRLENKPLNDIAHAYVLNLFNESQDWKPLLQAAGWTLHKVNEKTGERFWRQPGKVQPGWSAKTDYGDSTVMSIYTQVYADAEYDDLFINERRSPGFTNKIRFARFFLFNGDDKALIRAILVRGDGRLF